MEAHARGLSGSGNHCAVAWRIHHADKCFREWGPFGLGQWGGRWRCVLYGFALGRWKNACGKAPNNDQRFSHKMPLSRNCAIVSCLFNLGGYGNCEHGYVQDWGGGAHVREGFSPRKDASPCSFVSTQRDGKPRRTYGHAGHASRNRMPPLRAATLRCTYLAICTRALGVSERCTRSKVTTGTTRLAAKMPKEKLLAPLLPKMARQPSLFFNNGNRL